VPVAVLSFYRFGIAWKYSAVLLLRVEDTPLKWLISLKLESAKIGVALGITRETRFSWSQENSCEDHCAILSTTSLRVVVRTCTLPCL
jgi:hypothetical protein